MLFIITGNGKGKTTSALGMVVRATGHDKKCAVLQFIKSEPQKCGEYKSFRKTGVLWKNYGCGFTWQQESLDETSKLCIQGWEEFKTLCLSGEYYLIVLDEFTYVLNEKLISESEVIDFLIRNKEKLPNIVITGRAASKTLIEIADTVSDIREIKHHYSSNGHKAVIGLEF